MKKGLFIPAIGLAVLAMAGGVIGLSHNNVMKVAKAEGIYSITDDEYECAFLEQYTTNNTNIIETEGYTYTGDKPIGKHSVGGFQYGIAGNSAANLKKTNFETNLYGVNETLTWRFSGMNTKFKTGPNRLYVQIENNSSNWNICKAESFPNSGDTADFYAIGQLIKNAGYAKGAALISSSAISNIRDISFFWRSSYAQKVYVVYQLDGSSEWKILSGTGSANGNYTGTRGWDTYGYTTFSSGSWTEKELYGATARIGIACTEAPSESGNLPVSAILVNANKAAARYLNLLTYNDNICSTGDGMDLNLTANNNRHNQDLFQLATERAQGSFLANYELAGSKTTDLNALSFYNHLVSSVSGLGSAKAASSRSILAIASNNNVIIIAGVSIVLICASGVALYFSLRKKKHN